MRRLLVDLPLRVIRADVAGIACLGFARLRQAEGMPLVALLALADGAIRLRLADTVARHAGELGDIRPLQRIQRMAGLVRVELALGDRLIHHLHHCRQVFGAGVGDVGRQGMPALVELRHLGPVAALTHGRGRRGQQAVALVLDRAGVIGLDLVAVPARHLGRRHGAVAELIHDAGGGPAVTGDARVTAVGQRVGADRGLARRHPPLADRSGHRQPDQRQAEHQDDDDQSEDDKPRRPKAPLGVPPRPYPPSSQALIHEAEHPNRGEPSPLSRSTVNPIMTLGCELGN